MTLARVRAWRNRRFASGLLRQSSSYPPLARHFQRHSSVLLIRSPHVTILCSPATVVAWTPSPHWASAIPGDSMNLHRCRRHRHRHHRPLQLLRQQYRRRRHLQRRRLLVARLDTLRQSHLIRRQHRLHRPSPRTALRHPCRHHTHHLYHPSSRRQHHRRLRPHHHFR